MLDDSQRTPTFDCRIFFKLSMTVQHRVKVHNRERYLWVPICLEVMEVGIDLADIMDHGEL